MLVFKRGEGQSCCIGDDVTLTVLEAGHGWVRLGFEGPDEVSIDRAEVRERKLLEAARQMTLRTPLARFVARSHRGKAKAG